ncbi:MAG TPA: hypothetical protein VNF05_09345 [Acidimicrobiales bacterium]|nr:hypothetical protein [Acidimicrobiales bacterium]
MPFNLHRTFRSSKVPKINGVFWFLKLLTTAMGESTSDFFVHRFNPELAVLGGGVVFAVVLWNQLRAPRFFTTTYWAAVVMVSVFGTMCADVLHVGFHVPYRASVALFAVLLVGTFVTWARVEHTLSIHSIYATRRELFYWSAVTVTFALGTAVGDMTAYSFNLGYLKSGVLFAIIFILPPFGYRVLHLNAIAMFWAAYILTRPLGASFSDYLGVSHLRGGLNLGPGNVSLLFTAVIAIVVGVVWYRERLDPPVLRH